MKSKREKGYWNKKTESYSKGADAKSRAENLRQYEHISHVTVTKKDDKYVVSYSIANFWEEETKKAGLKI